jgi:hypothetical protein
MTGLDPILLGHNPFFGVNHLSAERGAATAERFEDAQRIADMLLHCHGLGVRAMMMSTHPRAAVVSRVIGQQEALRDAWRVYPLVPYIQKYVRQSNEKGMVTMVLDALGQASLREKFSLVLRGGAGMLTKDLDQALRVLIDLELLPFKGRQLGVVFLHDALTDLALGLGADSVLELFRDHVTGKHGARAGLVTKNLPLLRDRLAARGLSDFTLMASFNSRGFYVNPSLAVAGAALRDPALNVVAMNTLASGALKPDAAYKFLSEFPAIKSVVVGVSRKDHAEETVAAIRRHMPCAR